MAGFFVHPTAEVAADAEIGDGTKIWHQSQIMSGAKVGEKCNLGKGVYVDTGVRIGDRVKIQNGVSIYRGVSIASDCFLGPHMVFTNDLQPRAFNHDFTVIETIVERGASIGANATIVCGITLSEYCMVGAGSVVTKDVGPYQLVVGNPARVVCLICKCGKKLDAKLKFVHAAPPFCPDCLSPKT